MRSVGTKGKRRCVARGARRIVVPAVATLLALLVVCAPRKARADGEYGGLVVLMVGAVAAEAAIGVAGVTTAIGTGATLGFDPPPVGWRSASWGTGTLNLVSGAIMLGIAGSNDPMPWLPIGLANLALTATNFTLAGLAMTRADERAATTGAPLLAARALYVPVVALGGAF